jgi:hypothetical protein
MNVNTRGFILLCVGIFLLALLDYIGRTDNKPKPNVEIANELIRSGKITYDVTGARASGYTDEEIADYIVSKQKSNR